MTRCTPYNEGCQGGYPFLVGRQAATAGVFQRTTQTTAGAIRPASRCRADVGHERIGAPCEDTCLRPDPSVQPVYYAADYGYVGGFSQGASEKAIMREIYEHGPVAIELAVSAIPMLVSGNSGEVITTHNNLRPAHDRVSDEAVRLQSAAMPAHVEKALGNETKEVDFNDWLWTDHSLLSVGWGEAKAARAGIKPGLSDKGNQIILGTPLQIGLIQQQRPSVIKYWTIRNSWGKRWGNHGYGKLVRGQNAGGVEISAVWIKPDMTRLPDLPGALSLVGSGPAVPTPVRHNASSASS